MAELRDGVNRLKREIGYNPTYFMGMVAEHGPAEACRRLIRSLKPSDAFHAGRRVLCYLHAGTAVMVADRSRSTSAIQSSSSDADGGRSYAW